MANGTCRTPKKRANFLEALSECGNIKKSAKIAKIGRQTAYRWRRTDEDFAKAWDEALELGIDALEDEAMRRAVDGYLKPVFHGGKQVGSVREYSDTLLIFLLKGRRPERYAERRNVKLSGALEVERENPRDEVDAMIAALREEEANDAAGHPDAHGGFRACSKVGRGA